MDKYSLLVPVTCLKVDTSAQIWGRKSGSLLRYYPERASNCMPLDYQIKRFAVAARNMLKGLRHSLES